MRKKNKSKPQQQPEVTPLPQNIVESEPLNTIVPNARAEEPSNDDLLLLNLTNDIIDKQYRLYSWADSKTSSLIQTNSILLATIGFIFKDCLIDKIATISIFLSIISNVVSLFFCLRQVKPQKSSGKGIGNDPNLRALSGILKFNSWQDYYEKLTKINNKQLYEFNARQIYGMACNVEESRVNTTHAMRITLVGIFFIILSFISVSLSSNDYHLYGVWNQKKADSTINIDIRYAIPSSVEIKTYPNSIEKKQFKDGK